MFAVCCGGRFTISIAGMLSLVFGIALQLCKPRSHTAAFATTMRDVVFDAILLNPRMTTGHVNRLLPAVRSLQSVPSGYSDHLKQ